MWQPISQGPVHSTRSVLPTPHRCIGLVRKQLRVLVQALLCSLCGDGTDYIEHTIAPNPFFSGLAVGTLEWRNCARWIEHDLNTPSLGERSAIIEDRWHAADSMLHSSASATAARLLYSPSVNPNAAATSASPSSFGFRVFRSTTPIYRRNDPVIDVLIENDCTI